MFNWLKNLAKKQTTCIYESDTNDCSLIQQLKEKQEIKKVIKNDIESYIKYDPSTVSYIRKFLLALEKQGFLMGFHYGDSKIDSTFNGLNGVKKVAGALDDISIDDIDNMINELKNLKQRVVTLSEKISALKAIDDDIINIKRKLEIE